MQRALPQDRVAGTLLLVSAFLSLAALTHHPVVSASSSSVFVKGETAVGQMSAIFHGFMIVMIFALYLGLAVYSRKRGLQSVFVLAALVSVSIGLTAEVCAGLIDGFFAPAFGAHLARGIPTSMDAGMQVVSAAALTLQILAKFGVIAVTAAIICWSIDLFDGNRSHILLGALGCVTGLGSIALITRVASSITPHNAALVFAMQALWYAIAGVLMIRGSL